MFEQFIKWRDEAATRKAKREVRRTINCLIEELVETHPEAPERSRGMSDLYWDKETQESSLPSRTLQVGPYFIGVGFDSRAHVEVRGPDGAELIYMDGFIESGPWENNLETYLRDELAKVKISGTRIELANQKRNSNLDAIRTSMLL